MWACRLNPQDRKNDFLLNPEDSIDLYTSWHGETLEVFFQLP